MATEKPPLTVILSPTALDELDDIWRWNADHYSVSHADDYLAYLNQSIGDLAENYVRGKAVSTRRDLHYVLIRHRSRRHGHVAVYNFDDREVHILHIFHTAQDWQNKVRQETSSDYRPKE